MLEVTLTIHPGGDRSRSRVIGAATIANVSEPADVSSYRYELTSEEGGLMALGSVDGFDRVRFGAFDLLCEVIADAQRKLGGRVGR